ncbi:hypothetical protein [Lactococcus garvieae]|uniref:hypothetical protein n=1 Tax=Lactococcus garvieae TaxID=1363 RepID=UPI00038048CB|nr:hypothetical protein [Lactococcus garvieae]
MNKDNLNRIYNIEKEIKEIDRFLSNYYKAPRGVKLAAFKQKFIFSLQVNGYGVLPKMEYKLPYNLSDEILKVVRDYREKLVAEQNELWGSE